MYAHTRHTSSGTQCILPACMSKPETYRNAGACRLSVLPKRAHTRCLLLMSTAISKDLQPCNASLCFTAILNRRTRTRYDTFDGIADLNQKNYHVGTRTEFPQVKSITDSLSQAMSIHGRHARPMPSPIQGTRHDLHDFFDLLYPGLLSEYRQRRSARI